MRGGFSILPSRLLLLGLLLPALFFTLGLFGLPMVQTLRMSFNLHDGQGLYKPGFTLEHYHRALTDPVIRSAAWATLRLSLAAAVTTVLLGLAFALLAWLKPRRWRLSFIGLALLPLLVSEIAIIFGWRMIFPKNGLLSQALLSAGLISDKISLMHTEFAAFIGLVYVTLPYSFFMLISTLDGIDKRLLEASGDLGASAPTTLCEIILPLSWPAILVAFSQAFIWMMGIYATPAALGPDTLWTLGYLVQDQMLGKHNWPFASALGVVLFLGVLLILLLIGSLVPKRRNLHV